MITRADIERTLADCEGMGYSKISVKDISYFVLKREYQDGAIPYRLLFSKKTTDNYIDYENREDIKFLRNYMNSNFSKQAQIVPEKKSSADISFDENKEAMISMISELKQALLDGKIEYKEYSDRVIKLRVALNDKFNVADQKEQQYIIVEKKWNAVCEHCRHEIYIPTKEDLMEKYNLVERKE